MREEGGEGQPALSVFLSVSVADDKCDADKLHPYGDGDARGAYKGNHDTILFRSATGLFRCDEQLMLQSRRKGKRKKRNRDCI
jgi:hypothetical protein